MLCYFKRTADVGIACQGSDCGNLVFAGKLTFEIAAPRFAGFAMTTISKGVGVGGYMLAMSIRKQCLAVVWRLLQGRLRPPFRCDTSDSPAGRAPTGEGKSFENEIATLRSR